MNYLFVCGGAPWTDVRVASLLLGAMPSVKFSKLFKAAALISPSSTEFLIASVRIVTLP